MKKMSSKTAQSAIEFLILSALVLAAVVASNFAGKMQNNFNTFFDKATEAMK